MESASANTPTGAAASTHPTITSMASLTPLKNPTMAARSGGVRRATASASTRVNTTSGSIAPSAAARMGFAGIVSMIRWVSVGSCCTAVTVDDAAVVADARSRSVTSGVNGIRASSGGAIASAMSPATTSRITNVTSARTPRRPSDREPMPVATPVISTETTSGTTVIRIALTHRLPNGSMIPTSRSANGLEVAATMLPSRKPAASAART